MSEDIAETRAQEFLARFTPPEAVEEWGYNTGGLLYDFKHKYHFTPTTAQLQECVEAYVQLLDDLTGEFSIGILVLINVNELVLAYLVRAGETKALSVSKHLRDRLAVHGKRIVRDMKAYQGGAYYGDAVKRLVSINEHLKGEVPADRDRDFDLRICGRGDPDLMLKIRKAEEREARHNILKESILDYLRLNQREAEIGTIWRDFEDRFSGSDIIGACLELTEEKRIKPDKELARASDILRTTKFRLME
jgi:hypothetical protein